MGAEFDGPKEFRTVMDRISSFILRLKRVTSARSTPVKSCVRAARCVTSRAMASADADWRVVVMTNWRSVSKS